MAEKKEKILFIVTSHNVIGSTGKQTGWYLPEVAHPYHVWSKHYTIHWASPNGGKTPIDEGSIKAFANDTVCTDFLADKEAKAGFENTKTIKDVNLSDYVAVFYPGGHGPMFDLATNQDIANAVGKYYEGGGVVSAVCHGPVALAPIKLSNGDSIVKGKHVTGFTNDEEEAVNLTAAMPFLLETRLKELGGHWSNAPLWQPHVEVDGKLVTGQNPNSAYPMAEAVLKVLGK